MDGIINVYKPCGYTSHDVVARMKRFFGTRRVGHAGTLDPMACGVLPILIGSACTAQEYLMNHDKSYRAGMRFGTLTDTGDITGAVLEEREFSLPAEKVLEGAYSMIGEIDQVPPMYSAIKIDGRKLYELAREGKTVERKSRRVKIYDIKLVERINETDYIFDVACSKGTYIRTLCEDIGQALGNVGTLFSLERRSCGEFTVDNSVMVDELEALHNADDKQALERLLMSPEKVFSHLPVVRLPHFYSRLCKNGCEIYLEKLHKKESDFSPEGMCRLYDGDGAFFALGKLGEYKEGTAVKAVARF